MWVRVVKSRYGDLEYSVMWPNGGSNSRNLSSWWKNIGRCGESNNSVDWFKEGLNRRLGKGDNTKFWEDTWVGPRSFKAKFPRLFQISEQQNKVIEECGSWCEGKWEWDQKWRRNLFVWKNKLVGELLMILKSACPKEECCDDWCWGLDCSGCYTTKSTYKSLDKLVLETQSQPAAEEGVFKLLCKYKIPTKALTFTW